MADLYERLEAHRRRNARNRRIRNFIKRFTRRSLACLVVVAMLFSGTKMPAAYAYFTAETKWSTPITLTINGTLAATVTFLDNFLIEDDNDGSPDHNVFQRLTPSETIRVAISPLDDFKAETVRIPTVELHYADQSVAALSGDIDAHGLLVEFDRAEIKSWFTDRSETPDAATFVVTGEGTRDSGQRFNFSGSAGLSLVGRHESTGVNIDGPEACLIPEAGEKDITYRLINQDGTVLDAAWSIIGAADGITIDAGSGLLDISGSAPAGDVIIKAEFDRSDGGHTVQKMIHLVEDPHLTIAGPRMLVVGAAPEQYTLETRGHPEFKNVTWQTVGAPDGVTVDQNGSLTVPDYAGAGELILLVTAELKGIPLRAEATVILEEPARDTGPAAAPETDQEAEPDADLIEDPTGENNPPNREDEDNDTPGLRDDEDEDTDADEDKDEDENPDETDEDGNPDGESGDDPSDDPGDDPGDDADADDETDDDDPPADNEETDTEPDPETDTESDAESDTGPDTEPDAEIDEEADEPEPDAEPDPESDAESDAESHEERQEEREDGSDPDTADNDEAREPESPDSETESGPPAGEDSDNSTGDETPDPKAEGLTGEGGIPGAERHYGTRDPEDNS